MYILYPFASRAHRGQTPILLLFVDCAAYSNSMYNFYATYKSNTSYSTKMVYKRVQRGTELVAWPLLSARKSNISFIEYQRPAKARHPNSGWSVALDLGPRFPCELEVVEVCYSITNQISEDVFTYMYSMSLNPVTTEAQCNKPAIQKKLPCLNWKPTRTHYGVVVRFSALLNSRGSIILKVEDKT